MVHGFEEVNAKSSQLEDDDSIQLISKGSARNYSPTEARRSIMRATTPPKARVVEDTRLRTIVKYRQLEYRWLSFGAMKTVVPPKSAATMRINSRIREPSSAPSDSRRLGELGSTWVSGGVNLPPAGPWSEVLNPYSKGKLSKL